MSLGILMSKMNPTDDVLESTEEIDQRIGELELQYTNEALATGVVCERINIYTELSSGRLLDDRNSTITLEGISVSDVYDSVKSTIMDLIRKFIDFVAKQWQSLKDWIKSLHKRMKRTRDQLRAMDKDIVSYQQPKHIRVRALYSERLMIGDKKPTGGELESSIANMQSVIDTWTSAYISIATHWQRLLLGIISDIISGRGIELRAAYAKMNKYSDDGSQTSGLEWNLRDDMPYIKSVGFIIHHDKVNNEAIQINPIEVELHDRVDKNHEFLAPSKDELQNILYATEGLVTLIESLEEKVKEVSDNQKEVAISLKGLKLTSDKHGLDPEKLRKFTTSVIGTNNIDKGLVKLTSTLWKLVQALLNYIDASLTEGIDKRKSIT